LVLLVLLDRFNILYLNIDYYQIYFLTRTWYRTRALRASC
jgi:hypothetical protein